MKVVTAEQMRAIDKAAMERGVAGRVLMENAGCSVVEAVLEIAEELGPDPSVVVVAGKGNNGGDGLVVARHLHNRGMDVEVCLLCAGDELTGDAAANFQAARNYGVPITQQCTKEELAEALAAADIIVDAVLGTGISGQVRDPARWAIEAINQSDAVVVAVDIPSGVSADTGAICGMAVQADLTVTFGLPKVGNVVYPGAGMCGEVRVVDISLPPDMLEDSAIATELIDDALARACLPERWPDMHKGDAGRLVVVAGSRGYTGAAALSAMGALRAGAGLVYLAVPESCNAILEAKCTEAITAPVPETEAGTLSAAALDAVMQLVENADAVAIGPGLSRHRETAELVAHLIEHSSVPVVIDADGLNCLAELDIDRIDGPPAAVITPHPGELSRLTGQAIADIQNDRLLAARQAAQDFGAVVALKGAGTVVAAPDGRAWINATGSHALASGGTGDVLCGMIGAFLAGGAEAEEAAIAGVYFHGLAADRATEKASRRSLIASDLLDALSSVLPSE